MAAQKRGLHTLRRTNLFRSLQVPHRRSLHIPESQSNRMLEDRSVKILEDENSKSRDYFLEVTIDRASHTPCIITSYSIGGESPSHHAKSHPFAFDGKTDASLFSSISEELGCKEESFESLTHILSSLIDIFVSKGAFSMTVRLSRNMKGELAVARSDFTFDDAAICSSKRHEDIKAMRDVSTENLTAVEAEKDGIVYIK